MPIEKPPRNPLPSGHVPPGGTPYKVKTHDDWATVARAHGLSPSDLMHYNYGTTHPAEVNWYLRRNAGCVRATRNGRNWMFTSDAVPGIIYLPPKTGWKRPTFPHEDVAPAPLTVKAGEPSGIWFGFGAQGGGHFFLVGKDTVEACIYSLESYYNRFWMNIDGWRLGPGLGGSAGAVFIVVASLSRSNALQGFMIGGGDFQANMGERWADVGKTASKIPMANRLARAARTVVKGAIKIGEWEESRNLLLSIFHALELDANAAEPQVGVFAIPFAGVGVELSAYYGVGTIYVHNVTE